MGIPADGFPELDLPIFQADSSETQGSSVESVSRSQIDPSGSLKQPYVWSKECSPEHLLMCNVRSHATSSAGTIVLGSSKTCRTG